jgi:hypothetical protein
MCVYVCVHIRFTVALPRFLGQAYAVQVVLLCYPAVCTQC